VLPFGTCPAAAGNMDLSDALRALAEVPVLLDTLAGRMPG
jgi:hypothetical protein